MKTIKGTIRAILALIAIIILLASDLLVPQIVLDVQSGDITLECQMSDGWRTIDPEMVTGVDDSTGRWLFKNGSAGNCETYEN